MEETICKHLKGKTRIVATHAVEFAKFADRVILLEEGKIVGDFDSYEQLNRSSIWTELKGSQEIKVNEAKNENIEGDQKLVKQMSKIVRKASSVIASELTTVLDNDTMMANKMFFVEDREKGKVSFGVLINILNKLGGWVWFVLGGFLPSMVFVGISAFGNKYMLDWSKDFTDPATNTYNSITLGALFLCRNFIIVFKTLFIMLMGVRVSKKFHSNMIYRLFHAKILEFLDRIPTGRILNRFTTDIDNVDEHIMPSFGSAFHAFAYIIVD